MPRPRMPYLNHERTRHGRMIWVVRVGKGPRTRMRAPYGSPEFMREYHAAIESPAAARGAREPDEDTFARLWLLYHASPAWAQLSPATKKQRENLMRVASSAPETSRWSAGIENSSLLRATRVPRRRGRRGTS